MDDQQQSLSVQFRETHLFSNTVDLTCFDAMRALEEFRHDYPNEFNAEELAVSFDEPMTYHANEVYADLLGAREQKLLQEFVDHLVDFINEDGIFAETSEGALLQ